MLQLVCVELDPEKVAKTKQWIFSEMKSPNLAINIYSNEIMKRHVQFGDLQL